MNRRKKLSVPGGTPHMKGVGMLGPCGFRPFDFDSKLKIENQKFTIVISNV